MKLNSRARLQIRLQSSIFLLLFVALLAVLAWLSNRHSVTFDMSANQRNSLSEETVRMLENVQTPLSVKP